MSEDKKSTSPLSSFARPTQAMLDFFKQRTSEHIARVVKYMGLLKGFEEGQSLSDEALTSRAKAHDKDKYSKQLILPYLWITEYYRVKNEEGEDKISPALQRQYDLADEASGKHVETNPHHPEAHENLEDMSQLDLAEMVCDWAAMAEELGEGSPKGWADKNVGTKWKFSEAQVETIYAMIKWIEEKGGSTEKIEEGENGTSLVLHKNAVYRKVGWGETQNVILVQTCGRGNTEPECQGAEGFTIFPNYGEGKSKKKKPKNKKKARSSSNFKVALSPEQKNQKKDYLLQQQKSSDKIPSLEEVLENEKDEIANWAEEYAHAYLEEADEYEVTEWLVDQGIIKDASPPDEMDW